MADHHSNSPMNYPYEIVNYYIEGGIKKSKMRPENLIILSILAGIFIALGGASAAVATHDISNVGLAKALSGVIFPVGLMMIVFLGAELFTSNTMMTMGWADGRYTAGKMVTTLAIIYVANMVGAILIALLINHCGQLDLSYGALGAYTIKVAYGKVSLDFATAFCSGILCNILVCVAALMAAAAKDVTGKIFGVFFPIFAFIVAGYEHCIANMYYIPAGILAKANPQYVALFEELYHYDAAALEHLTWGSFLLNNLLPVTLGNIVGGGILTGLSLYFVHCKNAKH